MRLLACHVDNFGKLQDFDLRFTEGMNQIHQPNGWGKSTLAAFLKAMFYGLDPKKNPRLQEKERIYYMPWQGGPFGGWVEFETEGKRYRISRTFGRTEKSDEFHLYDGVTNLESNDYSSNIGEELFDLDSNSFARSIYIAQNDCESVTTDGIHAKLGNLVENVNDINNFETATAKLKDLLNHLSPTRATGSIQRRKHQMEELLVKLRGVDHVQEDYSAALERQKQLSRQRKELLLQKKEWNQAIRIIGQQQLMSEKKKQYEQLCEEEILKKREWESCCRKFPAGVPQEEEFRRITSIVRQIADMEVLMGNLKGTEQEQREYERLQEQFEKGTPIQGEVDQRLKEYEEFTDRKSEITRLKGRKQDQQEEIAECQRRLDTPSVKKNPLLSVSIGFYGMGCLLGVTAILLCVFFWARCPWFVPPILFGLDLFCLIVASVLLAAGRYQRKDRENLEREMMQSQMEIKRNSVCQLEEEIQGLEKKQEEAEYTFSFFLGRYGKEYTGESAVGSLHTLMHEAEEYNRLRDKTQKYRKAIERKTELLAQIREFSGKYELHLNEDELPLLGDIQLQAADYLRVKQEEEQARWKLQHFTDHNPMDEILKEPDAGMPSEEELQQRLARTEERLGHIQEELEKLGRQLELFEEQLGQKEEWEHTLEELEEIQKKELHQHVILEHTRNFLQRSREQFLANYRNPVEESFRKYYQMISGERKEEWQMDSNLDCRLRQQGQLRETRKLSSGLQDLMGICMRLALVDAMYPGRKPFLLLDDPFVNLDEAYGAKALEMLRRTSGEYQILYFTCHESRNYPDAEGIPLA